MIQFLSDKLASEVQDEEYALEALHVAEKKVKHNKLSSISRNKKECKNRSRLKANQKVI